MSTHNICFHAEIRKHMLWILICNEYPQQIFHQEVRKILILFGFLEQCGQIMRTWPEDIKCFISDQFLFLN